MKKKKQSIKKKNQNILSKTLKEFSVKKSFSDIKVYIIISLLIFLLFICLGIIAPSIFPKPVFTYLEENLNNVIKQLIEKTEGLNTPQLINFIFWNNSKSAFFGFILGIFLAIVPVSILVVNGFLLGYVIFKAVQIEGIIIIWRLFPHGVFEIPSILIATSLGIKIGIDLMTNAFRHYDKSLDRQSVFWLCLLSMIFFYVSFPIILAYTLYHKELRDKLYSNLTNGIIIFILIIIPLLIIAAVIEGSLINLI